MIDHATIIDLFETAKCWKEIANTYLDAHPYHYLYGARP